jgi:flagellar biosynthesis anti-sigma factor FlgM
MVDPIGINPAGRVRSVRDSHAPGGASAAVAKQPTGEPVALSLPTLLKLAREIEDRGPPIDYARIAQIRQAIATHNYPLDPGAIAGAIIRFD